MNPGQGLLPLPEKALVFRWKILGNNDQEIARIIDPSSMKEAFFRTLFTALPDSYALVSGENLIAVIKKEKLSKKIPQKPRNFVGKFLEKVFEPSGLTLRLEPDYLSTFDTRILLAGMTLLEVHDITGVNRQ